MRFLVLLLSLVILASGCAKPEPTPHVFVFLVDTLRADHAGVYGYERATTPRLDDFAQDAFVFREAYSASPWTRPSVTSLFTGLPPQIHGVRGRDGWLVSEAQTWAEELQMRGVHTVARFTNANLEVHYGLHQGFDEFVFEESMGRPYVDGLTMVDRWSASLDAQPVTEPWMHYLHLMDPHLPYQPRRDYRIPFVNQSVPWREWFTGDATVGAQIQRDVNNYDAEILQADAAFGHFLDVLRERGLYENSWIVFASDHGEEFREHGLQGHGHGLWENQLRIPLVVRPPGGRKAASASRIESLSLRSFPLHAVADLIGSESFAKWDGLGQTNLRRLGMEASVPTAWIPTPEQLAPALRRASFSLDGRGGMMVSRDADKLVWQELPTPGWRASDLLSDPAERMPSPRRSPDLVAELQAYALAGWRGVRVTSTLEESLTVDLRSVPISALREIRVPVGDPTVELSFQRVPEDRFLRWSASSGQSLILRLPSESGLEWRQGDAGWQRLDGEAQESLGLMLTPTGPPEDPSEGAPGPMDPELERKLRALGYLQ